MGNSSWKLSPALPFFGCVCRSRRGAGVSLIALSTPAWLSVGSLITPLNNFNVFLLRSVCQIRGGTFYERISPWLCLKSLPCSFIHHIQVIFIYAFFLQWLWRSNQKLDVGAPRRFSDLQSACAPRPLEQHREQSAHCVGRVWRRREDRCWSCYSHSASG